MPVWNRSAHARQVDVALNETCRIITGCLKPTLVQMLYPLAGIATPDVRRSVASGIERAKLDTYQRHPMHYYTPVPQRLKSRRGFYRIVAPVDGEASLARRDLWRSRSSLPSPFVRLLERLPPGHDLPRGVWQSLNRLRTQVFDNLMVFATYRALGNTNFFVNARNIHTAQMAFLFLRTSPYSTSLPPYFKRVVVWLLIISPVCVLRLSVP
ncbi:hypothetical protein B5X24_HaOG203561 [Helicoverpa armigera]|uniref:Uncharacterized protein n=1 Tax=Helicoverpa armigera TaxID=29058 RepID=A0A2W1BUC8_HELAM|nr:hypothetical protein B5X24_HaOG203561 [Helicoverpa armigera]